jgi:predicted Rossmann fold flavoprotein
VVATLEAAAAAAGVTVWRGAALRQVEALTGGGFALRLRLAAGLAQGAVDKVRCSRLLLATGGHPSGRQLASQLGHTVVAPVPSLFTLALEANPLAELSGVVMDPVELELRLPSGRFRERGPVLITHWGVSGPATLRLTAFAARALKDTGYRGELRLDWSGGASSADLLERLQQVRQEQARRLLVNARPWPQLSRRLWSHLLERHGVAADLRWADLRRQQETRLLEALRSSRYTIGGRGPFGEEFVTAGGVTLGEVNLATMESRRVPGLFFAGELLDVDGVTGGFNFQHCWTSGWLAGDAIAKAAWTCSDMQ